MAQRWFLVAGKGRGIEAVAASLDEPVVQGLPIVGIIPSRAVEHVIGRIGVGLELDADGIAPQVTDFLADYYRRPYGSQSFQSNLALRLGEPIIKAKAIEPPIIRMNLRNSPGAAISVQMIIAQMSKLAGTASKSGLGCDKHASFRSGGQMLLFFERESAECAERAGIAVLVAREEGLRAILDDRHA